jgi:hypothetical protein
MIAAVSAHLGRSEEARAAAAHILRKNPDFSIADWIKSFKITDQGYMHRLRDGLRKAGLPE